MNLSPIAAAVNGLCHECTPPAPIEPPAWLPYVRVLQDLDTAREMLEKQDRHRAEVDAFCGLRTDRHLSFQVVPPEPDWSCLILPPDAASLEAYTGQLYAGEVGYILEHRFVKNAGPTARWITRKEAEVPPPPPQFRLRGDWWKIGGNPPVFLPPGLSVEDVEAAHPGFAARRITEDQARAEIDGAPQHGNPMEKP